MDVNSKLVDQNELKQLLGNGGTIATFTGPWVQTNSIYKAIQAIVSGTGTVTATVLIDVSNDGVNPLGTVAGTITLSGTTNNSDGFQMANSWKYLRARVTAISGTNATVTANVGI